MDFHSLQALSRFAYDDSGGGEVIKGREQTLLESDLKRIIQLLSETDLNLMDIAARTGCGRGAVASINRRFGLRDYTVRRTQIGEAIRQDS